MSDKKNRFTFTWKIENFSMLPHLKGEELVSAMFVVDTWEKIRWRLVLYPRGDEKPESGGYVSLYFAKTLGYTDVKLNYTLALDSTEPSSEKSLSEENCVTTVGWGSTFISREDVNAKKNLFLPNDTLTVRFELSPAEENTTKETVRDESSPQYFAAKNCISRTSIQVHRRSMVWPIENINKLQENSIQLTSALENSPSLKISCNFAEMSVNGYIPIAIRQSCISLDKKRLFVKCKITVISAEKEFQDTAESTHLFTLELDDVFHFPPFIKTSSLASDKYLYFDDTLLLQCEFAFSYKDGIVYHSESNRMPLAFENKTLGRRNEFITGIKELYIHGKFCDVRLQVGDEAFPAIKMLLCARSNVFTAMFEHDMKEKNSNVVEITDVEPTTLKRMLDFIHVDAVQEELSSEDS